MLAAVVGGRDMPWAAIQYVGGAASLIAFLGALVAWAYRAKLNERENLIKSAPEEERAALVESALEFFHVPAGGLTRVHRYNIAIEQIRQRARRFLLATILIFLLACLAAASVVYVTVSGRATEAAPAFDIEIRKPEFFGQAQGVKALVPIRFFPVEKYENTTSTVFGGIISIHDLGKMAPDWKYAREKPCVEIPSCLAVKVFREYEVRPVHVRASGEADVFVNTILELPRDVSNIVVLAEFYQREVGGGKRCVVDDSRPPPRVGTPFLKVVDWRGVNTGQSCISAADSKIYKVSLD